MKIHKFTIIAFLIWSANSIHSIRISKAFRPYAIAMFLFLIVVTLQSCASSCQ